MYEQEPGRQTASCPDALEATQATSLPARALEYLDNRSQCSQEQFSQVKSLLAHQQQVRCDAAGPSNEHELAWKQLSLLCGSADDQVMQHLPSWCLSPCRSGCCIFVSLVTAWSSTYEALKLVSRKSNMMSTGNQLNTSRLSARLRKPCVFACALANGHCASAENVLMPTQSHVSRIAEMITMAASSNDNMHLTEAKS